MALRGTSREKVLTVLLRTLELLGGLSIIMALEHGW